MRAVDHVTFDVTAGERIALLGPSGAGKSTLMRALLGAVPVTGEVRVGGRAPNGSEVRDVRRSASFLRQGDDLISVLSAQLNAVLGTAPRWGFRDWCRAMTGRVPRAYADRLAELASRHDVTECLPAPVALLSGGQRQRVALIRALLPEPSLLLADEPTTGLDPVTSAEAVRALHGVDATVVVATHDLAVAATFDRVLALREGGLIYDGPPLDDATADEIYRREVA